MCAGGGHMVSGVQTYNEEASAGPVAALLVRGSGAKPHEAERLFASS